MSNKFWRNVKDSSPIWLTVLSGIGVAGVAYCSSVETEKFLKSDGYLERPSKDASKMDILRFKAKRLFRNYPKTIVCSVGTVGCMALATKVGIDKGTAALTAFSLLKEATNRRQEALVKTFGDKKEDDIRAAITEQSFQSKPMENEIFITSGGDFPVRDLVFGNDFTSCRNKIESAVNKVNAKLINEMEVTLNEFRYELGLPNVAGGYRLGWTIDNQLVVAYSTMELEDGRPALSISYDIYPLVKYWGDSIC